MYAKLSLHKVKIYAEELEYCEKKLRKSLYELFDLQAVMKRSYKDTSDEILRKVHKHCEELAWTARYVKNLRAELFNIIALYEKYETRLSKITSYKSMKKRIGGIEKNGG